LRHGSLNSLFHLNQVGYSVVGAGPGAPVVWTLDARYVRGGGGTGQIWMSEVECEGTERFLEECVAASYNWGAAEGCCALNPEP